MPRLDKERQSTLEPLRIEKAIKEVEKLGYRVYKVSDTEIHIVTDTVRNRVVKYFPYSGWATGPSIKDGRGLKKLLKQLDPHSL